MNSEYGNLSLLVNSCDLYEDAWNPFFRLLQINWKDCPEKVYLNTENKKYTDPYFDVITINSKENMTWSERLLNAVNHIETEYILFFLEDFFIREPVNTDVLKMALDCLENEPDVGAVRFVPNVDSRWVKAGTETCTYFSEIPLECAARNATMISIWRKSYLKSIIYKREDPWEFETYGSVRSRKLKSRLLVQNNKERIAFVFDYQIKYGYGISNKRWLKNNKSLFEDHGIEVNFENLGWYDDLNIPPKIVGLHRTKAEKIMLPFKEPETFLHIIKNEIKRVFSRIRHIRNRFVYK